MIQIYRTDRAWTASCFEGERVEVGIAVVVVLVLRPLERVYHLVGNRGEYDFDADLDQELRQHHQGQLVVGDDAGAIESERIEQRRVHRLAENGRAYGAGPQPFARGDYFHLRQHVGVDEFAAEVGAHGGKDNAPGRAEGDLVGRLVVPERRRRQRHHHRRHERSEAEAGEPGPDHLARTRVAVDFGEDVAEHIRYGEEQHAGAEGD